MNTSATSEKPSPSSAGGLLKGLVPAAGCSRRQFFGEVARQVARGTELGVLLVPAIVQQVVLCESENTISADSKREAKLVARGDPHRGTRHQNSASPLVITGVQHLSAHAAKDTDGVGAEMQSADIVLLESEASAGEKHERSLYGYFALLRARALKMKKETFDIDIKHGVMRHENLTCGTAASAAVGLIATDWKKNWKEKTINVRRFLRILGWGAVNISPGSPSHIAATVFSNSYPVTDISFTIDARTVFMMKHIEDFQEKNPGKKIYVIVGDLHAKGLLYYQKHPHVYKFKLALYQRIYGHLTGPAERVTREGWDRVRK